MAKFNAELGDEMDVTNCLKRYEQLRHIRTRRRADLITLISGNDKDPVLHARLRRIRVHRWQLEMPSGDRWQSTPFQGLMPDVLQLLIESFGWTLAKIE